ncbi:hypothetical protein PVAP13_8NG294984 [Panicum virgatum]|uniref:Uncharacterized protein n=1 Tax=Panicum virgatum TaxID=38727 RepID=A0A8T0PCC6_PANVG|nr:hypothetical protein PVAP13_8NG294984 [Panicum virgatum]
MVCFQKNPTRSARPNNSADEQVARAASRFPAPNKQSRGVKSRSPDTACPNQSSPPEERRGSIDYLRGDGVAEEASGRDKAHDGAPREKAPLPIQRPPELGGGAEDRRRRHVLRRDEPTRLEDPLGPVLKPIARKNQAQY